MRLLSREAAIRIWRQLHLPHPRHIPGHLGRQWRRLILSRLYPPIDADQICQGLRTIGVEAGRTIFVHSGWDEFYGFKGHPLTLLRAILDLLGPGGTLAMPAYPMQFDHNVVFDARVTPTGAGILAELFRRL